MKASTVVASLQTYKSLVDTGTLPVEKASELVKLALEKGELRRLREVDYLKVSEELLSFAGQIGMVKESSAPSGPRAKSSWDFVKEQYPEEAAIFAPCFEEGTQTEFVITVEDENGKSFQKTVAFQPFWRTVAPAQNDSSVNV